MLPQENGGQTLLSASKPGTMALLTLIEAAEQLRRTPRRLRDFLRAYPVGSTARAVVTDRELSPSEAKVRQRQDT